DNCVREIVPRLLALGGAAIITADHGNAEMMTDTDGHPHTAHTCNPVPFILVDESRRGMRLTPGILADIAPTILDIMNIDLPEQMSGRSLLIR
ncbi:MAG: 2,3-bisphosphoglycerate-independent phosphoglycerate mutase, partial [Desulfobacterales bacterium]|nr:2,3-bisphosphoglycerate-independent phosphoglycerate mutase [Desulfobacterales bacterium]